MSTESKGGPVRTIRSTAAGTKQQSAPPNCTYPEERACGNPVGSRVLRIGRTQEAHTPMADDDGAPVRLLVILCCGIGGLTMVGVDLNSFNAGAADRGAPALHAAALPAAARPAACAGPDAYDHHQPGRRRGGRRPHRQASLHHLPGQRSRRHLPDGDDHPRDPGLHALNPGTSSFDASSPHRTFGSSSAPTRPAPRP